MPTLAIDGGRKTVTLKPPVWPRVWSEEIQAVTSALRATRKDPSYLTSAAGTGIVQTFEKRFARRMGTRYAMTTSGCGPALHVALMAAGVQAGDEVICPTYSWGQTVSCVLQANAIPVFADIDPETYTMTARTIEPRITRYTRAVVVVHIYGHPADMDPIMVLARRKGLPVIEDVAQATGARYHGRRVGSLGHIGCFSIGDGKQIVGGEGGLLLTGDEGIFERALLFGQHPARHRWQIKDPKLRAWSDSLIYTYRIHPLAAVICNVMLDRMDRLNGERRRNHERLSRGLRGVPGIRPVVVREGCQHVYHGYSPTFVPEEVEGVSRETWVKALQAEGVPMGMGYVGTPIHLRRRIVEHAYFSGRGVPWTLHPAGKEIRYTRGDCPAAEHRCAHTELILGGGPSWIGDQSRLVDQILDAFHKVTENLDVLRRLSKRR
jgi:dTDP-4-amino-4,6-dideoxygalactose transaminase